MKYILLSKGRGYGIHSPFVFDLVTRVFRNKIDHEVVSSIENIRKGLISDNRFIVVKDLGSGAVSLKTDIRKVSDIARNSPVPGKYGILLSNMAYEFGKPHIIEFGTSFGISTMYMAAASTNSIIYTMEGCQASAEIAAKNFETAGLTNIKLFTGSFDETLPGISNIENRPGMVFIDGNHRKDAVLNYFRKVLDISDSKTVIIIDDINYSREMGEAWDMIKGFKEVTLTVDLFRMGIVFLREGINHNDYLIRY